jgi:AraC-like DNA-binding protein
MAAPLAPFVDSVWLYDGTPPAHAVERRLPDGMLSLIFNLRDDEICLYAPHNPAQVQRYPGALLTGARSSFALLDTATTTSVIGIQFKPGGASAFLPWPVDEIQESELSLNLLWGTEALDLRERLSVETLPACQFHLVEQFLLARLDLNRAPHPAVAFAISQLQRAQLPSIAEVSDQLALSRTRLNQLFRAAVGLTPKQYQRVGRFQKVLRLLEDGAVHLGERQRSVHWSELAISCGFYDQAHLTREFHLCAGMTPGAYLRQRGEQRNHVPVSA